MDRYSILFVDDEPNILSSVKRLFFNHDDFTIFTAKNVEDGIQILQTNPIEVVVSDEKMPKIQGHQFIQYLKTHYPDIIRCILTGYADIDKILHAVNLGEVYRYLVKPWNDDELVLTIRHAAEYGRMKKDNDKMKKMLEEQNKILQTAVIQRTEYLERALKTAKKMKADQDELLAGVVTLLSDVIAHFSPETGYYSKRVAELSSAIAKDMELDQEQVQRLYVAALLHEIGTTNRGTEETDDAGIKFAEELLGKFSSMAPVAEIIRFQHQNYDGSGYPGGTMGDAIPVEARILHVVKDYDVLCYESQKPKDLALETMVNGIHTKYDPHIVQSLRFIENQGTINKKAGIPIPIKELKPGMILRDDLFMKNGSLCIPGNTSITTQMVEHLSHFMGQIDPNETVHIRAAKMNE